MVAHGDVEFQWSEQHFKEGNIDVGLDAALLGWEEVQKEATLKNVFCGYSSNTGYDFTALKYDVGL
ncbi:MAG: hypothetical protein BM565_10945 [Gammaproteobacteria bacterium MedPE]|nr:MAG: hypothetical protein BM565_10945 [Gammaproteobacteria bacterium MedPE]